VASASLPRFVSGSELAYLLAIGGLLLFLWALEQVKYLLIL
jgi:hypothetical protein